MVNVNCTGGGGYFSEDVSATQAQIVTGKQTVARDSNDEVIEGTMEEIGYADVQKSNAVANGNLYLRMANGAHRTKNQTSGYPEVYIPLQDLRSAIGATDASKILKGATIAGLAGTMVNRGAWNGTLALSGSVVIPQGWHNGNGKITRSYATYDGGVFTPSASDQIIATAGKILTGDVKCKADVNLIAQNIRHGVSIMGITGAYFSPTIYDGGDATALFGTKSFARTEHASGNYLLPGGYATFDTSAMTATVHYAAVNTYTRGAVLFVSNKAFDISNFNTLTVGFVVTMTPQSSSVTSHSAYVKVGLSTSCERRLQASEYPDNASDRTAYMSLAGSHYENWNFGSLQNKLYSISLDLTEAKSNSSSYYPYVYITIDTMFQDTADATVNIRSLTFS